MSAKPNKDVVRREEAEFLYCYRCSNPLGYSDHLCPACGANNFGKSLTMPKPVLELVIEHPYLPEERHPWNDVSKRQFRFDSYESERLETGGIVWRGDTAYSIDDSH